MRTRAMKRKHPEGNPVTEVRNQIYGYIVNNIKPSKTRKKTLSDLCQLSKENDKRPRKFLAMIHVCRQIRAEFRPLYMAQQVVKITRLQQYLDAFVLSSTHKSVIDTVDVLPFLKLCLQHPGLHWKIDGSSGEKLHRAVSQNREAWQRAVENGLTKFSLSINGFEGAFADHKSGRVRDLEGNLTMHSQMDNLNRYRASLGIGFGFAFPG
ncbi:hypothetical protein BDV95DRAFT_607119 [Massariosphaeria phaeospora]|uniref:Uncharacterized protein n=1 Tax=Massariosphaeria phaeospora TaxID=100035 RepID=A0A7C8MF01_9PLEO|nr:hypothetical protein BDV95DRAFT_607119 [Massariosphaeria phaeospora]